MALMWVRCALCGSVVADEDLHNTWHRAHGDTVPEEEPAAPTEGVADEITEPIQAPTVEE